jgi:hypothetical protein
MKQTTINTYNLKNIIIVEMIHVKIETTIKHNE